MAGITDLLFQSTNWTLTSLDTGTKIEGQFVPTDLTENISAEYAEIQTLGRNVPILQFQSNGARTISFGAKCWAYSQGIAPVPLLTSFGTGLLNQTIEELVDAIKAAAWVNDDLGRPEIYAFAVGKSVEMESCVVKSVGGIKYDRLRPIDGSLRGASFSIEIQQYEEFSTTIGGSGSESLVLALRENEGFEGISRRVYGDADPGEALRRRNPTKVVPQVGDLIHLPPKAKLMSQFQREPQSWVQKRTTKNSDSRRGYFEKRDRKFTLYAVNW